MDRVSSDNQQLARALNLAQRRNAALQRLRGNPDVSSDPELRRLTSSLKMAVDTLLLAYQEEARNSPWYTFAAIKRAADVEMANAPHKAAQAAAKHGRDIIKDAVAVLDGRTSDEVMNATIIMATVAGKIMQPSANIDWDEFQAMFEDPGQRIANRLRQLQYDLLNAGLAAVELAPIAVPTAGKTELLTSQIGQGADSAHSAWIEEWYDSITGKGLDLREAIGALQVWLPRIDALAQSPDADAAESRALALEQRALVAAIDRLPAELREFAKP
ncbi:MAG: hypothetical protein IPK59_22600 [Rhodospirillaceae bacterium]|nr:hypothetical protein [Rhodospirillaceae bacterium]